VKTGGICFFLANATSYQKLHCIVSRFQALPACPSGKSNVINMVIAVKHLWEGANRGKSRYADKKVSHCHLGYHKSRMEWPGLDPVFVR
jgi:hypothetical protein